jgi:hypothetical protein
MRRIAYVTCEDFGRARGGALRRAGRFRPGAGAAAPPPITMKQLKPDVWAALGGAGGNSTIIGKTRDCRRCQADQAGAKDLLAEIAKITPKPVTTRSLRTAMAIT